MRRSAIFAAALVCAVALSGCGAKFSEVKGVVKLDGDPLEGATVTLITEDGKKSYSGVSDASGNFSILSEGKPGAPAGSYKVVVLKTKTVAGAGEGGMVAGGEGYMKMMAGKMKEEKKSAAASSSTGPKLPGTGGVSKSKNDLLPGIYGAASSTPFTATVPLSGPLELNLKSKP